MTTRIKDSQKFDFALGPITDKVGNQTTVQNPTWSSTDPAILELTVAPDGTSGSGRAVGPLGTASLRLDADADLGDGVVPIEGIEDIEVVAGNATVVNIAIGAITEQDVAPGGGLPGDGGGPPPPPLPGDGGLPPLPGDGGIPTP